MQCVITNWSKSAEKVLGYTESEMLGHHIRHIHSKKAHGFLEFKILPALKKYGTYTTEIKLFCKDSSSINVYLSLTLQYDLKNTPVAILVTFFDITKKNNPNQRAT